MSALTDSNDTPRRLDWSETKDWTLELETVETIANCMGAAKNFYNNGGGLEYLDIHPFGD